MDGRTAVRIWSGPVRGPDFWSEILFGPAHGPGRIIRTGPYFDPDFQDFKKSDPDQISYWFGPVRNLVRIFKKSDHVPKSVPVRIFGTVRSSMVSMIFI